jgi:hypothetical protein
VKATTASNDRAFLRESAMSLPYLNHENKSSPGRLAALAHCLARPVRYAWLSIDVADAALLLAADREPDVGDLAGTWHDLRALLRAELANARPSDQAQTMGVT